MMKFKSLTRVIDIVRELNWFLKQVPEINFVDYLEALLAKKNMSKSILINKANLHRTYAYQIFNGTKIPSRNIYQVQESDNKIIVIEEYINAPTLEDVLLNESLSKEKVINIFSQVC